MTCCPMFIQEWLHPENYDPAKFNGPIAGAYRHPGFSTSAMIVANCYTEAGSGKLIAFDSMIAGRQELLTDEQMAVKSSCAPFVTMRKSA